MLDTPNTPLHRRLDYDPHVRDRIARLLDELNAASDPEEKERTCNELDLLILHGD